MREKLKGRCVNVLQWRGRGCDRDSKCPSCKARVLFGKDGGMMSFLKCHEVWVVDLEGREVEDEEGGVLLG